MKRLTTGLVLSLAAVWVSVFLIAPAIAEESAGADAPMEAPEADPDADVKAFVAVFLRAVHEDEALRDACAADFAGCLAARDKQVPGGREIAYAYDAEEGHSVSFKSAPGDTRTVRMSLDGEVSETGAGGFAERGATYNCGADQYQMIAEGCYGVGYFYPQENTCMNPETSSCRCSDFPNRYPCSNTYCGDVAIPCGYTW